MFHTLPSECVVRIFLALVSTDVGDARGAIHRKRHLNI